MRRLGPKYQRVHAELRARIERHQYPVGEALPSQQSLAAEFGITLATLRQAVQLLAEDRLVEARQGSGTFVLPAPVSYGGGPLRSFGQDVAAQGGALSTRVIGSVLVAGSPSVCARLALLPGSEVLELRRLRLLAGRPVVVQTSWLPGPLGRRLDVGGTSLYEALAACGVQIDHATETLHAETLAGNDAEQLDCPPGSAALVSRRLTFDTSGQPVCDDLAHMLGSHVLVSADRRSAGVELNYQPAVAS